MKIDRLLGITIYLLNHKKVSAHTLARRFEVSTRTILRDIESLCMAGIPVVSTYGADGGYEILNTFKMERQVAGQSDYTYIVAALQGFVSAYTNNEANAVLEKMQLSAGDVSPGIILDFSVLKENESVGETLTILEDAISKKHVVTFTYTNANNDEKKQEVEPVAVVYKWYAWYLLAYSTKYDDYTLYKLVRLRNIFDTGKCNTKDHNAQSALKIQEKQPDTRKYIDISLRGSQSVKGRCIEYLSGVVEREYENGDFLMKLHVPENEHFWYASILSMGNQIKVLEPQSLRMRICDSCKEILKEYGDI